MSIDEHGDPRSPTESDPIPWDLDASPDGTLGGYFEEHARPPAFEGPDGEPYTVSLEIEQTANLAAPYDGYLVFPRWATRGLGVVGHVETPTLVTGVTRDEVATALGKLPLRQVKRLLDEAVRGETE